jgi:hypothetical protein
MGGLNKYQSEIENMIKKEINELRMKIDNIKEEVTHNTDNLRKKNESEIQNTTEGHSSKLEQEEDRISELEDEMEIKLKSYQSKNSRPVKGICKNLPTPTKDKT